LPKRLWPESSVSSLRGVTQSTVACLLAALVTACSGPPGPSPTQVAPLVVPPNPTPSPLAVEPSSGIDGPFFRPASWDGVSDLDCSDFDSREHAQSFFLGTHGSKTNDPFGLDGDHDGVACEDLK
jgi:hypothetical protein